MTKQYKDRIKELEAEGLKTSDAQAVADLELIRAEAPSLLKELEENVEAIRDVFKDEHRVISWDELEQLLTNILNDNLNAIAKAKGGNNE